MLVILCWKGKTEKEKKKNIHVIYMILRVWLNYKTLVVMYLSSVLSTMIIICVTHLFVNSAHIMDRISISPRLILKFSLKVHFILCNLTVSDILTLLILVEFPIGDNIFVFVSLTLTIASLLKMDIAILVMIKILKVLYIPMLILLLELVTAPMIR